MSTIWIMGIRATHAEIMRGVAAAEAIFTRDGREPEYCHRQVQSLDDYDYNDELGIMTWRAAESAAIDACCAGMEQIPDGAYMVLT